MTSKLFSLCGFFFIASVSADILEVPISKTGLAIMPWEIETVRSTSNELSFEKVIRTVEKNFPLTELSKMQVDESAGRSLSAGGAFDFRLSAQTAILEDSYTQRMYDVQISQQVAKTPLDFYAGWRRGLGQFRAYEGKSSTGSDGEMRLGFKLPLLRNFLSDSARAKYSIAEFGEKASREEFRFKVLEYKNKASEKYWDWIGAYYRTEMVLKLYDLANSRLAQVRRKVQMGSYAAINEVEMERTILDRKVQLIESEQRYQKFALELSLYNRDPSGKPDVKMIVPAGLKVNGILPAEFEIGPAEEALENALTLRGDLLALNQNLSSSEVLVALSENQILPRLDANFEYAVDRGAPKEGETEVRGVLSFSMPLENRESRGNLIASRARLEQAQINNTFLRDQIRQEVLILHSSLLAAYQKARALQLDQELTEKLAAAERRRFTGGLSSLLIVNLREQSANDVAIKALESAVEFQKIKARYLSAQGKDLI
jgi:outer membrane protein, heavy metal efflux system